MLPNFFYVSDCFLYLFFEIKQSGNPLLNKDSGVDEREFQIQKYFFQSLQFLL